MRLARDDSREALAVAVDDAVNGWGGTRLARAASEDDRTENAAVRAACWARAVELGWNEAATGASEHPVADTVAILEPCGRHVLPTVVATSLGLAAPFLRRVAEASARAHDALHGGLVSTLAVNAVDVRWHGRQLVATGVLLPDGDLARHVVVPFRQESGTPAVAIATVDAGRLHDERAGSVDPSAPVLRVDLVVPAGHVDVVPADVNVAWTVARIGLAASLVGVADGALALTLDHVRARHQFGRPIGSFQAVKHRLADVYVALERARGLVDTFVAGGDAHDDGLDHAARSRLALGAAGEAALQASRAAVQMHGAIGMTWEHDAHLYVRRALRDAMLLGSPDTQFRAAAATWMDRSSRVDH